MGLVTTEAMGRMRIVSANWDLPWADELARILDQTVGVVAQIEGALAEVGGVDEAFIFGSWAARRAGTAGPPLTTLICSSSVMPTTTTSAPP